MPRPSRLTLAKSEIFAHFTKVGPRAYAKAELNQILTNHTGKWRLVKSTNVNDFITFLQKSGGIKTYEFHADAYDKTIIRYAWVLSHRLPSRFLLKQGVIFPMAPPFVCTISPTGK